MKIKSQKIKNVKILLFFGIFCTTLLIAYQLFFWADRKSEYHFVKKSKKIERLSQKELEKLEEGDIILRRGYGFFSDLIAKKLNKNSPYDVTHSGILFKKNKQWFVIHSLSSEATPIDGIQEQSLSDFLYYCVPNKILVVRVKNTTLKQRQKIVEKAHYYLEKKVPFDRLGIIDEPSKMYCTELIWQILDTDLQLISLPKEHKEREKVFHSMKGTYNTKWFEIIINTYKFNSEK